MDSQSGLEAVMSPMDIRPSSAPTVQVLGDAGIELPSLGGSRVEADATPGNQGRPASGLEQRLLTIEKQLGISPNPRSDFDQRLRFADDILAEPTGTERRRSATDADVKIQFQETLSALAHAESETRALQVKVLDSLLHQLCRSSHRIQLLGLGSVPAQFFGRMVPPGLSFGPYMWIS
ncbi:hypothetical protein C8R46DRAFT_1035804 [Mycena filopes]|nr:hypothetical protein C8R46DRAFT_1035804 [Mycena filopes]